MTICTHQKSVFCECDDEAACPLRTEALRLADALTAPLAHRTAVHMDAAAELRRLHELNVDKTEIIASLSAINAQLLEALKTLRDNSSLSSHQLEIILPAINAAKENT